MLRPYPVVSFGRLRYLNFFIGFTKKMSQNEDKKNEIASNTDGMGFPGKKGAIFHKLCISLSPHFQFERIFSFSPFC